MSEECSKSSIHGSKKEKQCINPSGKLLNDSNGYQPLDAPVQRHDYEAIGGKFEVDHNRLTIMKRDIGKGHFSDVHMGMLSLPTGSIPVAVKTLQMKTGSINAAESEAILRCHRQALRDELCIFAHLQSSSAGGHENVLKLLGAITTIKNDFCLLTEYCECGSMDRFLQTERKNFRDELVVEAHEKIRRDSDWGKYYHSRRENDVITRSDLMWFALQTARAMQFLAAMKVVHRDIALRNVLLKLDFTVKVADFGLARKLKKNNDAYHILKNETALPIRYIAPESLKSHRFAITSELWSFGVVIWELFTFAEEQPYSVEFENHKSNLQFFDFLIEHLSSGQRLSIPNICPQQIKNLLTRLWDLDPEKRPSFQECEKVIEEGLMQSCPNMHEKLKNALERSLHDICQDLDAEDVLPYLRSKGIVTDRQTQEIMKSTRKFTQNMQLIDYIKGAGPSAFHEFINSLQACNKEHIAEKILAHLPSSSAQQLTLLELNTVQAPCSSSSSSTQSNTKNWEKALELKTIKRTETVAESNHEEVSSNNSSAKRIRSTMPAELTVPQASTLFNDSNLDSSAISSQLNTEERLQILKTVQKSLKQMYLQRFRKINPFSMPFTFDIENTWVSLEIKEYTETDEDSDEETDEYTYEETDTDDYLDEETDEYTDEYEDDEAMDEEKETYNKIFRGTQDHAELLKNAFSTQKMLIIEGKPAMGKTSLMRRLAYEWAKGKQELSHFDLIIYAEFREVREHAFESITDLVVEFNKSYINFFEDKELEYLKLHLSSKRYCGQTLLLLDGYDESSLDKQCKELSTYISSSTLKNPLLFNIVLTTRPGYLSIFHRRKGRFVFAEILGFITNEQKKKYISNHFSSKKSNEKLEAVHSLLVNNKSLNKLAKTPLFLTFICLVHEKIIDGTLVELYCNIIKWLIDRHQQDFPDRNVPILFQYQENFMTPVFELSEAKKKHRIIQDKYLAFPQLQYLGKMAYHYLKVNVFQESHINQFNLTPILQQVGLLRKEEHYDHSLNLRTTFAFPHRTIQEFLAAYFCFCSDEQLDEWTEPIKKLNTGDSNGFKKFLLRIALSKKLLLNEGKRNLYFENIRQIELDFPFDSFNTIMGMNCELFNWFFSQCTNVQTILLKGPLQSVRHIPNTESTFGYNDSFSTSKVAKTAFLSFNYLVYLHSLTFRSCPFDVSSQLSINNCPFLKNVECNQCKIKRPTTLCIASLPITDSVVFNNCTFEAYTQLSIKNCPSFKKLRFKICKLKNNATLDIESLQAIDSLILDGCTFEAKSQLSFTNCSSLKNLEFSRCEIKSNTILDIATLSEVADLKFSYSTFEANSELAFTNCLPLKNWEFYYCKIESGATIHIAPFLFISHVKFSSCSFEANSQLYFRKGQSLKNLEFNACKFKSSTNLGFATLPTTEIFSFHKCTFEDNCKLFFTSCPSLKKLKFSQCEMKNSTNLDIASLPAIESFSLEKCTFEASSQLTFKNCPSLKNLIFNEFEIKSSTNLDIASLPAIESFSLEKCTFAANSQLTLKNCPSLKNLIFNECEIKSSTNLDIASLPAIESFSLEKCTFAANSQLTLKNCKSLKNMKFSQCEMESNTNFDIATLSAIVTYSFEKCVLKASAQLSFKNYSSLKNLKFTECEIKCSTNLDIASLPAIESFSLEKCTFEASSQLTFNNCPSLKNLKFSQCEMKNSTNLSIATLPAIETVEVYGCTLEANSQLSFTSCPSLKHLKFWNCEMKNNTYVGIATLAAIKTINFGSCTFKANSRLSFTNCSSLKNLTFNICEMENSKIVDIATLPVIDTVEFFTCKIDLATLQSIINAIRNSSIKCLKLSFRAYLNEKFSIHLQKCNNVEKMEITIGGYTRIRQNDLFSFTDLIKLHSLSLGRCTFEANSRLSFSNCPSLKNLNFIECAFKRNTNLGIATLPAIDTVEIYKCDVDMATWQSITDQIRNSPVKYLQLSIDYLVKVTYLEFLYHLQKCERIQQIKVKDDVYKILNSNEEEVTANLVQIAQKLPGLTSIIISDYDGKRLCDRNKERIEKAGQERNPNFLIKYVEYNLS